MKLWNDIAPDFKTHKVVIFRNIFGEKYFHCVKMLDEKYADSLLGLQSQIEILDSNTKSFLDGNPASNVLLWGARGMGKSACIKAVIMPYLMRNSSLRVIEVSGKDLEILPLIFDNVYSLPFHFIIFCDDIVLDRDSGLYGSFKSSLEGSFAKKPDNILIYATSNLKHVVDESKNQLETNGGIDEMMSLSDRFPLSIGFYPLSQSEYLSILEFLVQEHLKQFNITDSSEIMKNIRQEAINFATKIGNRSPRTAKDFFNVYFHEIFKTSSC